jgi:hypothetical protein
MVARTGANRRYQMIQRKTCKQSRHGKRESIYIRLASLTEGYVRPVRPSLPESVLGLCLVLRCVVLTFGFRL